MIPGKHWEANTTSFLPQTASLSPFSFLSYPILSLAMNTGISLRTVLFKNVDLGLLVNYNVNLEGHDQIFLKKWNSVW